MRLKSFYAKTMTEAMQMVRETLGEDAIIVATREERGGKAVRVTAAVEPHFEVSKSGAPAAEDDWLQYDDEQDEAAIGEELTEVMLRHSVPEEVMDQIISCATVAGLESPQVALVAALEHLFPFKPLPRTATHKAQMLVGPPGSGKTLAVAKMAARAAMNGLTIGVITTDTVRAGGVEQLHSFTKLLRTPLERAENAKDLRYIIADMDDCDHILIDTPGTNPFDTDDLKSLARLIGAADITPHLAMAGGGDAEEAAEMARAFSTIGVESLLPTRLDISRRLGGVISAAHYGRLTIADGSNTPKVADGLIQLDPQKFAQIFTQGAYRRGPKHAMQESGRRSTGQRTGHRTESS